MTRNRRLTDSSAIESRLAARLATGLTARSESLSHDVSERLRVAREQAVQRARAQRQAVPADGGAVVVSAGGGQAVLGAFMPWSSPWFSAWSSPWWQRAASVLPLLVLVTGLVAIDRWAMREQVLAAAEIDAQLLADKLPPAAYSDPGFAEFLRSAPSP